MEILTVKDLSFAYPLCEKKVLRDVSFSIEEGELAVLSGRTGSGKSTLLRLLKRELMPKGELSGQVLYRGEPTDKLPQKITATRIGFVMQDPEHATVCDKVWHELAFGLENLNLPQNEISRRVCEMASYFGIEEWFDKRVSELSGGQRQLLCLASVMVMDPEVLILDEPTASLDPIAASEFLSTLKKINRDFSVTVIISEHRTEEIIPICDKLIILDNGSIAAAAPPSEAIERIKGDTALLMAMPTPARLRYSVTKSGTCPLTVREGRAWLSEYTRGMERAHEPTQRGAHGECALEFSRVYYRYQKALPDVIKGLSVSVFRGEIFAILGGNGSGKSTTLGIAAGLLSPYSGTVRVFGKKLADYKNQSLYRECLALLPQNVQTLFLCNTVREELADIGTLSDADFPFSLEELYDKHPYDLSGGEAQLVALAKALMTKPRLLLMDEPTKGIDAEKKQILCRIMKKLSMSGVTIVMVTHDVEFAAMSADRCALLFRGEIVSSAEPVEFFSENKFYTTAARRLSRGIIDGIVTTDALIRYCRSSGGAHE